MDFHISSVHNRLCMFGIFLLFPMYIYFSHGKMKFGSFFISYPLYSHGLMLLQQWRWKNGSQLKHLIFLPNFNDILSAKMMLKIFTKICVAVSKSRTTFFDYYGNKTEKGKRINSNWTKRLLFVASFCYKWRNMMLCTYSFRFY